MTVRLRRATLSWALFSVSLALWADPTIRLAAIGPAARINLQGPVQGQSSADIACARGEYESFQVVVTAENGNLDNVDAAVSSLRSEGGVQIAADNLCLYREIYIPIRHSSPRATCPPGLTPDPLVPFVNPYTKEPIREPRWKDKGREGPRFGAAGFDLWQDYHQPLWVDVYIPKDTAPGFYTGTVTVRAANAKPADLPVRVEVWDFELPDGPTHENHFGGVDRVAQYLELDAASDAFRAIEDRYFEMMAAHRINPPIPSRLYPKPADDGAISMEEAADRTLAEFIERYHITNVQVPSAPFGEILGADREKALHFYRSWYQYLEKKGWAARAYLYMLDEPNDPEAYEQVRRLGALVHEAAPALRCLVVEQPYTQDPKWGTLDGAVDIWCPLFGFVHEASVNRVKAQGDDVWSYTALVQPAPPYHPEYEIVKGDNPPYWQIDFPLLSYRIAPWLNRRYAITGLLYWSSVYWGSPDRNPWDDPGFRIAWNGEGALFYPGNDAGIEGPVASMRLKNLRDGMEDYEYFALLEARGGADKVDEIVKTAVPTWGRWDQDPLRLEALRRRLAVEILAHAKT